MIMIQNNFIENSNINTGISNRQANIKFQNNFYQNTNFTPLNLSKVKKISILKPNILFRIFLYTIPIALLIFFIGLKILNFFNIYLNFRT